MEIDSKPYQFLTRLNEITEEINNIQNKIRDIEITLKENHDRDKKIALDMRLKYSSKIEDTMKYLKIIDEINEIKTIITQNSDRLSDLNQELHHYFTDNLPDDVFKNSNKIKELREEINRIKLEMKMCSLKLSEKEELKEKLNRKYRDSIDKSQIYFDFKMESIYRTQSMVDEVNKEKMRVIELRNEYSFTMNELEKISEDIHEQRRLEERRKNILDPLLDFQMSSMSQYTFDDHTEDRDISSSFKVSQSSSASFTRPITKLRTSPNSSNEIRANLLYGPIKSLEENNQSNSCHLETHTTNKSTNWHPLL